MLSKSGALITNSSLLNLQALLKLTSGFLKREFQATPDLQNEDGVEYK